jgi:hypothetical protein
LVQRKVKEKQLLLLFGSSHRTKFAVCHCVAESPGGQVFTSVESLLPGCFHQMLLLLLPLPLLLRVAA